jgi:hypothetical protein
MKNKNVIYVLIIGIALTLTMCSKDEKSAPPYVGNWQTDVFEMQGTNAKMEVEFAETNILAEVAVMVAANTFINILGVKGTVEDKPNQMMDVSLTDLGQWDPVSNDYDWKNRTNDAAEFEGIYQGMGLAAMIPKDFEAEYIIVGDAMDLVFEVAPSVTDTINLTRK